MACISKAWFSSNFHRVRVISLAVFIFLCSPVILLLILGLQTYRKLLGICVRLFKCDLDEIVVPRSAVLASDDIYGIPNYNVVSWFVLKGKVSIDSLQSTVYEKVVNKVDSGGNYLYPTLQQFPVPFHKFLFWRWDADFKIENHVYIHEKAKDDNKCWNEDDIMDIQHKLLRKQWTHHRSLWEVFLIPNFKPSGCFRETKTVLFLRFHESLGDPASWFRLFILDLCDCDNINGHHVPRSPYSFTTDQMEISKHTNPLTGTQHFNKDDGRDKHWFGETFPKSLLKRLRRFAFEFVMPFRIPFDFATQIMEPRDENAWNVHESQLIKRDHLKLIDKFSIHHIKEAKNMLGVSFTSILLAACTSAIRITLINLGITIPRTMKIAFPIVHDCHCNQNLGNYMSPCLVKLPTGIASAKERLRLCHEFYTKMRRSSQPASNFYLKYLLGLLPYKYSQAISRFRLWTGNVTSLPGPLEYMSIAEHPIEDMYFSSASDSGFLISFLTYAEYIRISIVIDERLIPPGKDDLAKDILRNVYAEIIALGIQGVV